MSGKMESRPLLRSSRPSGYSSLSSIDETNPHPPLVEATKPVDKILKANEQTGMIPFPDEEEDLVLCISEVESGRPKVQGIRALTLFYYWCALCGVVPPETLGISPSQLPLYHFVFRCYRVFLWCTLLFFTIADIIIALDEDTGVWTRVSIALFVSFATAASMLLATEIFHSHIINTRIYQHLHNTSYSATTAVYAKPHLYSSTQTLTRPTSTTNINTNINTTNISINTPIPTPTPTATTTAMSTTTPSINIASTTPSSSFSSSSSSSSSLLSSSPYLHVIRASKKEKNKITRCIYYSFFFALLLTGVGWAGDFIDSAAFKNDPTSSAYIRLGPSGIIFYQIASFFVQIQVSVGLSTFALLINLLRLRVASTFALLTEGEDSTTIEQAVKRFIDLDITTSHASHKTTLYVMIIFIGFFLKFILSALFHVTENVKERFVSRTQFGTPQVIDMVIHPGLVCIFLLVVVGSLNQEIENVIHVSARYTLRQRSHPRHDRKLIKEFQTYVKYGDFQFRSYGFAPSLSTAWKFVAVAFSAYVLLLRFKRWGIF